MSPDKYTIKYLLDSQPEILKRFPDYSILINYFNGSPELKNLKFSETCLRVLNRAKVKPENLNTFYKTHNLPKNPFFPLFFKIKREYFQYSKNYNNKRINNITEGWKQLPTRVLIFISRLKKLEKEYNLKKRYPFWKKNIVPNTVKKLNEYKSYSKSDWIEFFLDYLRRFTEYYKIKSKLNPDTVIACFVLGVDEKQITEEVINRRYHELCKIYHPDTGGESDNFLKVKWAKEYLIAYLKP